MRANLPAIGSQPASQPPSNQPAPTPTGVDIGKRATQLGVEMADINGVIADLVSLNGEVKKTLSGVVEAVDENSSANSVIATTMDTTLRMAADAQSSLGQSAEQISDTLTSTMDNVRQLGDGAIEVAASIRQIQRMSPAS